MRIKTIILTLTGVLALTACKLTEKPEFVRIDKIDVIQADFDGVTLQADAVFMNHNHLGGTLRTDNIDVFVDDHLMAKVSSKAFEVPPQDNFVVPLLVNFDTSKLLDNKNTDLLGSLLKQFLDKKVVVRFTGNLAYEVVGFSASYPIDHTEEVKIR